jgi:alpha-glucosidase
MKKTNLLLTKTFQIIATPVSEDILRLTYAKLSEEPNKPTIGVILKAARHALKPHKIEHENTLKWEDSPFSVLWDEAEGRVSVYHHQKLIQQDFNIDVETTSLQYERLHAKAIYGLGEKYDWMNRIETATENWNTDVLGISPLHHGLIKTYHTAMPFHITACEHFMTGRYFDNSFRTRFNFDQERKGIFHFSADGGALDSYIMIGDSVKAINRSYAKLTGTMPMPRMDYLGYQQCRWSYMDESEVLEIAKTMRKYDIPLDIIYLDIDYMDAYKVFTYDELRFGNIKKMTDELRAMGIKTVAIIDPGVKVEKGYFMYDEGIKGNYFVTTPEGAPYVGQVWPGDSVYPDFAQEEVRTWWGKHHQKLIDMGIDGVWNDMNEPADSSTEDKTIPSDSVHLDDDGAFKTHAEIHNLYATYEAKSTYDAMKTMTNKRPFVLTRAASSGTQRHAALWTGDNSSLWEHLEGAIPMLVNLGLTGYSFIGGDIGGFLENSHGELLVRWTQLGTFMPLFRNHSSKDTLYQEPWCFGDEVLLDVKKAIENRYQLISYLYSHMRESHLKGDPVIRPMFFESLSKETMNLNDQFFFGKDLLVCPVYRPGVTKRMVYLPEGDWYDYQTGEKYTGGYQVVDAPLNKIPVFVKSGTILPIDPIRSFISGPSERIALRVYGGRTGTTDLYIDDGISFDYEHGKCVQVTFEYRVKGDSVYMQESIEGDFKLPKWDIELMGDLKGMEVVWVDDEVDLKQM